MNRQSVVRPGDSTATAWLKRNPQPGLWAMLGLRAQTDEIVVRLFRFPDGSVLESVQDGGDTTDWRASAPSGFTDRDRN